MWLKLVYTYDEYAKYDLNSVSHNKSLMTKKKTQLFTEQNKSFHAVLLRKERDGSLVFPGYN